MLPEDRKWAVGVAIAISVFFVMVILAGRAYLTDLDDAFLLREEGEVIEVKLALWMMRNDSKNVPVQINPPTSQAPSYAEGRIYLHREYIAENSLVTLQIRAARPIRVMAESAPIGGRVLAEVLHSKFPGHRPIITVNPKPNSNTTMIRLDEIDPVRIHTETVNLDPEFGKSLLSSGYVIRIREDIFAFSGRDDFWKIEAFDSITGETEAFNGMALFKVRLRLIVELADGTEASTQWMETEFFAVDLVELPD